MRTDDLIRGLAADTKRAPGLGTGIAVALVAGLLGSAILFSMTLRIRPDFSIMATDPRLLLKFAVTLTLASSAGWLVLRLSRPGARAAAVAIALLVPVAILATGLGGEMAMSSADSLVPGMIGHNARFCVSLIPVMAAPILGALLLALRRGAPSNPTLAGAVAGLVAGGLGAALYALHCTDDSPFFVLVWYSIGIAVVTGIGAWIGRRVLAW